MQRRGIKDRPKYTKSFQSNYFAAACNNDFNDSIWNFIKSVSSRISNVLDSIWSGAFFCHHFPFRDSESSKYKTNNYFAGGCSDLRGNSSSDFLQIVYHFLNHKRHHFYDR